MNIAERGKDYVEMTKYFAFSTFLNRMTYMNFKDRHVNTFISCLSYMLSHPYCIFSKSPFTVDHRATDKMTIFHFVVISFCLGSSSLFQLISYRLEISEN